MATATNANGSKAHEVMFRQLIERIVLESTRSTDKPSGKGGATGIGFMPNFTPAMNDLATRCPENLRYLKTIRKHLHDRWR
jgi:hypothetical protein